MGSLKQPESMCMEGSMERNWKQFKRNFDIYSAATELDILSENIQVNTFLHCIGQEGRELYDTFEFEAGKEIKLEEIKKKFGAHYLPKVNVSVQRHKFNTRIQKKGEQFQEFLADLRKIAQECDFGTIKDDLIRDHIVCGLSDTRTKDRLLRETKLTLERTIEICRAAEKQAE